MAKVNRKILYTYILISSLIIIKCYYASNGFLNSDSTYFLQVAQNLSSGNGLTIEHYTKYQKATPLAIWPPVYPVLISTVHKISGLSVFWASKVLNILVLGLNFLLIFRIMGKRSLVFSLVLFSDSFLNIFSFTWSENVFILGLLWFSYILYKSIEINFNFINLSQLFISIVLLMFTRYIGAFAILILAVFSIREFLKGSKRRAYILGLLSIILLSILFLYLYNNRLQTGFITGVERIKPQEGILMLTVRVIYAQLLEFIPINIPKSILWTLVIFIAECTLIFLYFSKRKTVTKENTILHQNYNKYAIVIGVTYWLSVVSLRYIYHFDNISYRFLAPFSMLLFIAIINKVSTHYNFGTLQYYYVIVSALFVINLPFFTCKYNNLIHSNADCYHITYSQNMEHIKKFYSEIPENSAIIFGNYHMNYLFEKKYPLRPYFLPYYPKAETLEEMTLRLKKLNIDHAFFQTNYIDVDHYFNPTIIDFIEQHKKETFVKIF